MWSKRVSIPRFFQCWGSYLEDIYWIVLQLSFPFFFFPGHASCSSLCRCVEQQRMAVTCAGRHGACPNGKWARAHSQKREMKDFESLESSFRSIVVEWKPKLLLCQTKMSQGANESSTRKRAKMTGARVNACDQVANGFSFASDWFLSTWLIMVKPKPK